MTEKDAEDVLVELLENTEEVDIGYGPVRVVSAHGFGSRMLTMNRGLTVTLEWEEEVEREEGDEGPNTEMYCEEFQLVVHATGNRRKVKVR